MPAGWEKTQVGDIIGKVQRTEQIKTADYHDTGSIPVIDQSKNFIAGYTDFACCWKETYKSRGAEG